MQHKIMAKLHSLAHRFVHKAHFVGHGAYLGLVSFEAHGTYRYAAAFLLVVMIIGFFTGEGVPE